MRKNHFNVKHVVKDFVVILISKNISENYMKIKLIRMKYIHQLKQMNQKEMKNLLMKKHYRKKKQQEKFYHQK